MKKIFTAGLTALVLASASAETNGGRASTVGTLAHRGAESTGRFVDIPPVTVSGLAALKGLIVQVATQDGVNGEVVYKGVPGATVEAPVVAEEPEDR